MQLIHAEIIDFRHEVHNILLSYRSALVSQDNWVDGLDCGDDWIEHEDERPRLEVIDRLSIILKQDYLVIAYQIAQFELIGEVEQLQQIVVDHEHLLRRLFFEDFVDLEFQTDAQDKWLFLHYLRCDWSDHQIFELSV